MKILLLSLILFSTLSCQKSKMGTEKEVDVFFERLSVLITKKNTINFNIQNAQTTRTKGGGAYIPKEAVNCRKGICDISTIKCRGVGCAPDGSTSSSHILKYEPNHPDANANGYVSYPNINISDEMSKMIRVTRALEYLMETIPVTKTYFYGKEIQKYFKKYPALNYDYNFEGLLRE